MLPTDVKAHDRVALPEPATLAGETLHNDVVFVARLTTLAKPFRPVTVIVDVAVAPASTVMFVGFVETVKSRTLNRTLAE